MTEQSGTEGDQEIRERQEKRGAAREEAVEREALRALEGGTIPSVEELRALRQIDHALAREMASTAERELARRRELESSVLRRSREVVQLLSGLAGGLVVSISVAAAASGIWDAKLPPVAALTPLLLAGIAVLATAVLQVKPTRKQPPAPTGLKAAMAMIGADREAMRRFAPGTAGEVEEHTR